MDEFAQAAIKAKTLIIPADYADTLLHTKLIGGGETTESITALIRNLRLPVYIPGSDAMMHGKFIVE